MASYAAASETKLATTDALVPTFPDGISKLVVLPQTTKSIRGACFSPFVRAYAAELNAHGIDQDTFVGFIDGLNEAFVVHPVFEAINIAGAVVGMTVPVPDVQYAAGGVAIGTVFAGRATSYARTKAYLKAVNTNLFNPAGLNVSIMNTKKMMEELGCAESALNLPPFDTFADINEDALAEPVDENQYPGKTHPDDPRMRRIRALEGHVMQLNFDIPPPAASRDNFLKRMGDAHMTSEKVTSAAEEGKKAIDAFERQSQKIQKQIDKEKAKLEEQAEKREGNADKELRKKDDKEEKIARKIRWVVIAAWNGEEDDDSLSKVSSESSVM